MIEYRVWIETERYNSKTEEYEKDPEPECVGPMTKRAAETDKGLLYDHAQTITADVVAQFQD